MNAIKRENVMRVLAEMESLNELSPSEYRVSDNEAGLTITLPRSDGLESLFWMLVGQFVPHEDAHLLVDSCWRNDNEAEMRLYFPLVGLED